MKTGNTGINTWKRAIRYGWMAVGLAVVCCWAGSAPAAVLYSDNFTAPTLNTSLWTVGAQNGNGSVSVASNYLAINGGTIPSPGNDYQAWMVNGVSGAGWNTITNVQVSLTFLAPNITISQAGYDLDGTLWVSDGLAGNTFYASAQKALALEVLFDSGSATDTLYLYGKSAATAYSAGTLLWRGSVATNNIPLGVRLQVSGSGYALMFDQSVTTLGGSLVGTHGVAFGPTLFANISGANSAVGRGDLRFDNYEVLELVPEPSILSLLLAGPLVLWLARRR